MGTLQKINHFRRNLMNSLTRNIGNDDAAGKALHRHEVKHILVSRPNHRLGNLLLVTPLLQELETLFPNAKTDLFGKGDIARDLLKNYNSVDRLILLPKKHFKELGTYLLMWFRLKNRRYDLVINVAGSSSSGRISTKLANAKIRLFSNEDELLAAEHEDYAHMAKAPVYNLRKFLGLSDAGAAPVPTLNIKLSAEELSNGEKQLFEITKNHRRTICIYTYATGDKCFSPEWWEPFYNRLLREFPEHNIVEILPAENVSQIGFKAPAFYSKDLRLIAAVIANTEIFIGADSGMMHLASASQVPVAGLFSVTNLKGYQPYGNHSTGINTNNTHLEDWIRMIRQMLVSHRHIDGEIGRAANY